MYATATSMQVRFGSTELLALADPDSTGSVVDAVLTQALADASGHPLAKKVLQDVANEEREHAGEIVTGLIYIEEDPGDMHDRLQTVDKPLNQLTDADIVPGAAALAKINASLR